MSKYFVWCVDGGEKPDAPNIEAYSEERAALKFVEWRWATDDNPPETRVHVEDATGCGRCIFCVEARPSVEFFARQEKMA